MTHGRGCTGSRRLPGAAASLLPGAALALLPKCPACLAVWLSVATGVGVTASAVAQMREAIVIFWIAALALALLRIVRRARFLLRAGAAQRVEDAPLASVNAIPAKLTTLFASMFHCS